MVKAPPPATPIFKCRNCGKVFHPIDNAIGQELVCPNDLESLIIHAERYGHNTFKLTKAKESLQ